ncbi:6458_t:CDS:2 [Funneliformis mosseae]|uniref:6458_t:CDS:1 n=1 Tax=Funneliformis mosseae TaxID=27381 RepID=A0A9N9BHH2_FUNMO|nr:6458_t:CDS:2 [Funneliformis mosseae]
MIQNYLENGGLAYCLPQNLMAFTFNNILTLTITYHKRNNNSNDSDNNNSDSNDINSDESDINEYEEKKVLDYKNEY